MANVSLKHVEKIYDNNVQAVFDFNLDIQDKEFIVFVGPSGCGKSTTLRMIAGLEEISGGELFIDGKYSNNLAPQSRDIAMVFQNYALYPHMTVYDNMAFGLRNRKVPVPVYSKISKTEEEFSKDEAEKKRILENSELSQKDKEKQLKNFKPYKLVQKSGIDKKMCNRILKEISLLEKEIVKDNNNQTLVEEMATLEYWYKYFMNTEVPLYKLGKIPEDEINRRILEAAKILEITQYLKRKPKALSGGQCQRVALGRAIVRHAKVFLMDEPLSNLDAKLRVSMRSELIKIHKNINATTIYVTHDQTEAMTMADRIVCMRAGHIQQIGTPSEIYDKPANKFVATFIGSPAMNIVEGYLKGNVVKVTDDISFRLSNEQIKRLGEILTEQKDNYSKLLASSKNNLEVYSSKHKIMTSKVKKDLSILKAIVEENEEKTKGIEEAITKKEGKILVGFRAEHVSLSRTPLAGYHKAIIDITEMLGEATLIHALIGDQPILFKTQKGEKYKMGDDIYFKVSNENIYYFEGVSEKAIYVIK